MNEEKEESFPRPPTDKKPEKQDDLQKKEGGKITSSFFEGLLGIFLVTMAVIGIVVTARTWSKSEIEIGPKINEITIVNSKWWGVFPEETVKKTIYTYDSEEQKWIHLFGIGEKLR